MDKSGPEQATKIRGFDSLRISMDQKELNYGLESIRKSLQDPAERFVMDKSGLGRARKSHKIWGIRFVVDKSRPERITKARGNDLLRIRMDQKEPPRTRGMRFLMYKSGLERTLLWIRMDQEDPPRPGGTICYG